MAPYGPYLADRWGGALPALGDGLGDGVLAVALNSGCQGSGLSLAALQHDDLHQLHAPFGEGASFIKDKDVGFGQSFQSCSAFE